MSQPIVQTHSMQATRTRPWQAWRELPESTCPRCNGQALRSTGGGYVCQDCVEYFVEDVVRPMAAKARYHGLIVAVVQQMNQLAIVELYGYRTVVEVADLTPLEVR